MLKFCIVIFSLYLASTNAEISKPNDSIRSRILKILPLELQQISRESSVEDLKRKFGTKIALKNKNAIYLKYFSSKERCHTWY